MSDTSKGNTEAAEFGGYTRTLIKSEKLQSRCTYLRLSTVPIKSIHPTWTFSPFMYTE